MLSPQLEEHSFILWWKRESEAAERMARESLNSLVILGAWILLKILNECVFDGSSPCMAAAIARAAEERELWEMAGARGISSLTAPSTTLIVVFLHRVVVAILFQARVVFVSSV